MYQSDFGDFSETKAWRKWKSQPWLAEGKPFPITRQTKVLAVLPVWGKPSSQQLLRGWLGWWGKEGIMKVAGIRKVALEWTLGRQGLMTTVRRGSSSLSETRADWYTGSKYLEVTWWVIRKKDGSSQILMLPATQCFRPKVTIFIYYKNKENPFFNTNAAFSTANQV